MFGSIVSFLEEFFEVMGVSLTSQQVGFHLGCPQGMGIGHLAVSLAQPRAALLVSVFLALPLLLGPPSVQLPHLCRALRGL